MATECLEHLNGPAAGQRIQLGKTRLLIGRADDCDIVVEPAFSSVSRRHAVLACAEGAWTITDEGTDGSGSAYGTYLNGVRLAANTPAVLHLGDEIRLGGRTAASRTGKHFKLVSGEATTYAEPSPNPFASRLVVDIEKRVIVLDNQELPVRLSPLKFKLLALLWKKQGAKCAFKEIWEQLWPEEYDPRAAHVGNDVRVRINELVKDLRKDLRPLLDNMDIVQNYWGEGYGLRI